MAIEKVNYDDKVDLQIWASIPNTNKIKAEDMNQIKNAVNQNADELEITKNNTENLQATQTEQDDELLDIYNVLPTETETGENITMQGTGKIRIKEFGVEGNSKQETRSGKNLLYVPDQNVEKDGCKIIVENGNYNLEDNRESGVFTTIELATNFTLEAGTYTVSNGRNQNCPYVNLRSNDSVVGDSTMSAGDNGVKTITVSENTLVNKVAVYFGTNTKITDLALQLEKGTQATEFEPYGAMPSPKFPSAIQNVEGDVNVTVCNKNLLKNEIASQTVKGVEITKNEDGSLTLNGTAEQNMWIEVSSNVKAENGENVLSLKNKISGLGLYLGSDADTDYAVTQSQTSEYKQFTLAEGKIFDVVRLRIIEGTSFANLTIYLILEATATATDYIPNEQQVVTFPLAEGQKLYEGSYLAEDGIHHKRKQVELDGKKENVSIFYWTTPHEKTKIFTVLNIVTKKVDCIRFCNYFKVVINNSANINKDEEYCFNDIGGTVYFSTSNEIAATIEEFKTWLAQQKEAGTPITIEYELAEEEIEAYTPEQQTAYNQLKKLKSYAEVTHIYSTNSTSPIFNVTAIKNANAMYENLNSKIENIIELLSTTATSAMLLDNMQSDLESEVM